MALTNALRFRELLWRVPDALRRRAIYAWSRWAGRADRPRVEDAARWLGGPDTIDWVPAVPGDATGCPATTAMALGTARSIGLEGRIGPWVRWLSSLQQPDGSLPAITHSALWNTCQFVRGVSAAAGATSDSSASARRIGPGELPVAPAAIRAACGYVRSCVESAIPAVGCVLVRTRFGGEKAAWAHAPTLLPAPVWGYDSITEILLGLAVWRLIARHAELGDAASAAAAKAAAEQTFSCFQHRVDPDDVGIAAEAWAWRIEAFLDLDWLDLAADSLRMAAARLRDDGSFDEQQSVLGRTSIAAIPHLAALWYRSGQRDPADRAMRFLERRRDRWDSRTLVHYLDAAVARVAAAFDATAGDFPDRIDPHDGRAESVVSWFNAMEGNASVADVGCGKGRFLRLLAERFPAARWTGIDVAPAMLAGLPPGVTACRGTLLQIPLPDGCFDGAFAVESLEHALLPERAVSELCRIVRPGGRVLVIDKHRARQPLSHHDPWERWFTSEELAEWLRCWCDDVVVRPVSHLEGRPGRNLFLAAVGRKR